MKRFPSGIHYQTLKMELHAKQCISLHEYDIMEAILLRASSLRVGV